MAMRMASNNDGNGDDGNSDGNGNKVGRGAIATRVMAAHDNCGKQL